MKLIRFYIVFILILLVCFDGHGQSQLENKVIATLLNNGSKLIPEYKVSRRKGRVKTFNRHKMPEFVLLNTTKSPLKDAEFDTTSMFERKVLLSKDREMLCDFCEKNRTSLKINPVDGMEFHISYISNAQHKKIFAKKDDWHLYYVKNGLKPLVSVSRPGFNEKKNKAFIYMTYSLGKNDGAGYYLVMKKSWGKWKIRGPMLVWVM